MHKFFTLALLLLSFSASFSRAADNIEVLKKNPHQLVGFFHRKLLQTIYAD